VTQLGNRNVVVAIQHQPISISMYRHLIEDADVGAHAWFEGVTRRMTGELETVRLTYEGFEPMALREMNRIAECIVSEFKLAKLLIAHRLGEVPLGEASLIVGCSAPHRVNVLLSLAKIVDQLKADVPIWKKEHFANGETQWVHPK